MYNRKLEIALVNGGGSGMGRAIAQRISHEGFQIYVSDINEARAQETADPTYPVEMHVLRLGDTVIATNPFELFLDYGVRIQARSPAEQTILIQLASPLDFGYYVPTSRALQGGGYSAIVEQSLVGPAGGQALVERTVETINQVWGK